MNRSILFWIVSAVITISAAYYQRVTGPTYSTTGKIEVNNEVISFELERSHSTTNDYRLEIRTDDPAVSGEVKWRRVNMNEDWQTAAMKFAENKLYGEIPKQPPAGKVEYFVTLYKGDAVFHLTDKSVVMRFKGDVPLLILIPHILAMFGSMLLSTRTGLETFRKEPKLKSLLSWTVGFLLAGGLILGPIAQYYAFGLYWTGFPVGTDLTDNKTLIAIIGWMAALIAFYKFKNPKRWIQAAAIVLLIVFTIPHSMHGTELDYKKLESGKSIKESIKK